MIERDINHSNHMDAEDPRFMRLSFVRGETSSFAASPDGPAPSWRGPNHPKRREAARRSSAGRVAAFGSTSDLRRPEHSARAPERAGPSGLRRPRPPRAIQRVHWWPRTGRRTGTGPGDGVVCLKAVGLLVEVNMYLRITC